MKWRRVVFAAVVTASLTIVQPVTLGQPPPQTGSIAGRVKITARVRGAALSTNAYAPRAVSVQASSAVPEMRSVVVYLKDPSYRGALPVMRRGKWGRIINMGSIHSVIASPNINACPRLRRR